MKTGHPFLAASPILLRGCLLILILFYSTKGFSQKKQMLQADVLVAEKKYGEAILIYTKIYEKKKEKPVLLKIADANFLNENYTEARLRYAEYFQDTLFQNIPQFANYAKSSKMSGKLPLAVKLYKKMYDTIQDPDAKTFYELYQIYADSAAITRSYDLDSNYNCIVLDAKDSYDTLAAPMFYSWIFDDGQTVEGTSIEHCFKEEGDHTASLNITDKATGLVKFRDTLISIHLEKLPIKFTAPKKGKRYFFIEFEAGEINTPGYEAIEYIWDLDNGETQYGKKIKYRFNSSRDYFVKLYVIAKDKNSGTKKIFSARKRLEILENYETPSKKFTDALNEAK